MRRTIDILEKLSDKQKIAIDFDDYQLYCMYLQVNCSKATQDTYLDWGCKPDKKFLYNNQKRCLDEIKRTVNPGGR